MDINVRFIPCSNNEINFKELKAELSRMHIYPFKVVHLSDVRKMDKLFIVCDNFSWCSDVDEITIEIIDVAKRLGKPIYVIYKRSSDNKFAVFNSYNKKTIYGATQISAVPGNITDEVFSEAKYVATSTMNNPQDFCEDIQLASKLVVENNYDRRILLLIS